MSGDNTTATLRVVSPCQHGINHDVLELTDGAEFYVRACRDSKGRMRMHVADKTHYPETRRRR